jgi:protein SCO1/2
MSKYGRIVILAATLGIAIGLGAALLRHSGTASTEPVLQPVATHITWSSGMRRAPDFSLLDQTGAPVSLRSLRGRPILLTFLDSRCARDCPSAGRSLADVQRSLGRAHVVIAVVSVDPWADTPTTAAAYAHKSGWTGRWYWLFGNRARLAPVWNAYSIGVKRYRGSITNTLALYVIDSRGYLRSAFAFPFSPASVADDVRGLAHTS